MKKTYLLCLAALMGLSTSLFAQGQKTKGEFSIGVVVDSQEENIPAGAAKLMETKLTQIAAKNGVASSDLFNRFFITVKATPLTKDIVPGPPQMIAQNLSLTFYFADYVDQKVFETTSVEAKGVGTNDTKSYINAIKAVNINNPELSKFIENGKKKVIEYYNKQCPVIIKKANSLADQKLYEEALASLIAIPEVCDCYDEALAATKDIYQRYVDYICDVNLALAKSAWAAEQNSNGARLAGEYLSQIYPDAKCYGEATALYNQISAKVLDDWKFEMKKYQDEVDLRAKAIDATRDVGVAFGNHQQPVTTYNNLGWCR